MINILFDFICLKRKFELQLLSINQQKFNNYNDLLKAKESIYVKMWLEFDIFIRLIQK